MRKKPAFILILFLFSCRRQVPEMLIRLDGAKDARAYSVSGMDLLEYKLDKQYPAKEVTAEIDRRLESKGWKPLPYLYLYPKYKSSHVDGWSMYQDPPKNPAYVVYEWSADWQDKDGNIVTYTFRYLDPFQKYESPVFVMRPGNSTMLVTALYMEKVIADHRRVRAK